MPNSALSLALDFPPFGNLAQTAFAFYNANSLALSTGSAVSSWPDLSPNARNLSLSESAPTYQVIGGKECVDFSVGTALQNTNFNLNGLTELSVHFNFAYEETGQDALLDGPLFINETGSWGVLYAGINNTQIKWRFGSGLGGNNQSTAISAPGINTFSTVSLIRNIVGGNVTERVWLNGTLVDTKNLGSTNTTLANLPSTLLVGRGSNNYTRGYLRGFAFYNYNTEAIRADIEAALG